MRKAKIIATIGPSCENPAALKRLAVAGMDACRLNFSFGTHEGHKAKVDAIRAVAAATGKPLAIIQDLQGPKIRVGKLQQPVTVKKGDALVLTGKTAHDKEFVLPTTYHGIAKDAEPGKLVYIADGRIIVKVVDTTPAKGEVQCVVVSGGTIISGKGINLPYTNISLPALTPKDAADAVFGASLGVDYIALSFVRTADDARALRRLLDKQKAHIPIIAKIEKPEAVDRLDEILDVVDGVMVARGDLADELTFAKVPAAQKRIIAHGNRKGKLTITATEMLSSMVENPLPTRAEVSDCANAILDGSDVLMLSNETATGKHPVKAVKAMADIIEEAETSLLSGSMAPANGAAEPLDLTAALCASASNLSYLLDEKALVVLTTSGASATALSKQRPQSTIIAATFNETVFPRLALLHNVIPVRLAPPAGKKAETLSCHESMEILEKTLLARFHARKGDKIIVIGGANKPGSGWGANSIVVHIIDK